MCIVNLYLTSSFVHNIVNDNSDRLLVHGHTLIINQSIEYWDVLLLLLTAHIVVNQKGVNFGQPLKGRPSMDTDPKIFKFDHLISNSKSPMRHLWFLILFLFDQSSDVRLIKEEGACYLLRSFLPP